VTKILFAYDGSDESRRALRYAEGLVAGDAVVVIGVVPSLIEAPRTTAFTDPSVDAQHLAEELEEVRELLASTGIAAEVVSTIGNPAAEILNAAEARGVELIVVGRHGQGAVERFLMGSVADRVVRHAACDVLVVK
jgi:nucleotide-binding universal stress UspA family protein